MKKTQSLLALVIMASAQMASAASHVYTCKSDPKDQANDDTVRVILSSDTMTLLQPSQGNVDGKVNASYTPRHNVDAVLYDLTPMGDEAFSEAIVSGGMLNGQDGYLKLRWRGEGYAQVDYRCVAE